jgi:hypothetical protein
MFEARFHLFYVFMCDRRQRVDRGIEEQVQESEEKESNFSLEKGK